LKPGAKPCNLEVGDHPSNKVFLHSVVLLLAAWLSPAVAQTLPSGAAIDATKTLLAYNVMQLVDQGKLNLDTPLKDYLAMPLPSYGADPVLHDKYGPYNDLADDPRWQKLTPRLSLTHSTGFGNFWFIEPDRKPRIHFEPGTSYG
jgi:hypothetical protein